MNQNNESHTNDYICLLGIDSSGNSGTLASSNYIHVDNTTPSAPTITGTKYPHNMCWGDY